MTVVKHILAIALAAAMLLMGAQKFGAENLIFATIADNTNVAFFEPIFRVITGVLEIVAGLLMFHPKTRALGAAVSTSVVIGAVGFHLSPALGIKVALEAGAEPTYQLFIMAIVFLVLALANLFLNRAGLPTGGRR